MRSIVFSLSYRWMGYLKSKLTIDGESLGHTGYIPNLHHCHIEFYQNTCFIDTLHDPPHKLALPCLALPAIQPTMPADLQEKYTETPPAQTSQHVHRSLSPLLDLHTIRKLGEGPAKTRPQSPIPQIPEVALKRGVNQPLVLFLGQGA